MQQSHSPIPSRSATSSPRPTSSDPPPLLTLKVLRAARPALARSERPYFEDESVSGVGKYFRDAAVQDVANNQTPWPSFDGPDVLARDDAVTNLLTLPASFGVVNLGETFTAFLSLISTAQHVLYNPTLNVVVQTSSNFHPVNVKPLPSRIEPGGTIETTVSHDIKELGTHALTVTVGYSSPKNPQASLEFGDNSGGLLTPSDADMATRTFRKVYKFQVSNPLSVRTKVHAPRSPMAIFDEFERHKVFLEVQVSNISNQSMYFERMRFEPAEGSSFIDTNTSTPPPDLLDGGSRKDASDNGGGGSIFDDSFPVLNPGDIRQYLYIIFPASTTNLPPYPPKPGSQQNLGRLDIVWRTPYGDSGRLQTSQLVRKTPALPPPPPPASPPSAPSASVSAPPNPNPLERVGSPAFSDSPSRPSSPLTKGSLQSQSQGDMMPQDEITAGTTSTTRPKTIKPSVSDLTFDLTVKNIPYDQIKLNTPFAITFNLKITDERLKHGGHSTDPAGSSSPHGSRRKLKLAAQWVNHHHRYLSQAQATRENDILSPRGAALLAETLASPTPMSGPTPLAIPGRPESVMGIGAAENLASRRASLASQHSISSPVTRAQSPILQNQQLKRKGSLASIASTRLASIRETNNRSPTKTTRGGSIDATLASSSSVSASGRGASAIAGANTQPAPPRGSLDTIRDGTEAGDNFPTPLEDYDFTTSSIPLVLSPNSIIFPPPWPTKKFLEQQQAQTLANSGNNKPGGTTTVEGMNPSSGVRALNDGVVVLGERWLTSSSSGVAAVAMQASTSTIIPAPARDLLGDDEPITPRIGDDQPPAAKEEQGGGAPVGPEAKFTFSMSFVASDVPGFMRIGGLRILCLESESEFKEENGSSTRGSNEEEEPKDLIEASVGREWPVFAEVWVHA